MSNSRQSKAYKLAFKHYMAQIWRLKHLTIPGLLLPGLGSIFVFYVPPMIISRMIERFNGVTFTLSDSLPYIVALGALWMFGELLWRAAFLCHNYADSYGIAQLYKTGLRELLKKDQSFFQDNFSGSLAKKLFSYGKSFEAFMDTLGFSIFANTIPLIFVLVVLWQRSPLLTFVLLISMLIMLSVVVPLTKKRKRLVDIREVASNQMAGHVADIIANISTVHAFANDSNEQKQHEKYVDDLMSKALKAWNFHTIKIDLIISPAYVLINVIGLMIAISVGNTSSQVATMFLTFSYFGQATRTLWEFNRIYRTIENSLSEAAQFTEILLENPRIIDPENPEVCKIKSGDILFDNVTFGYGESKDSDYVFDNLNLHIKAGEKIALVGPSGGGKSTITKLLLRFADINSGNIVIDDQKIDSISRKDLRNSISYVPQDPLMFHRTILENIRYGKQNATTLEVEDVASKSHSLSFIEKLPNKFSTLVGERGTKLSGGQRQRIAIARAMLKNAPILILDEATSALDSESEVLIQDALWKLMENKTTIIIAHRLSTIQKVDRIILLDNGAIVEQGSHIELLKNKDGLYARLWKHQSGGFLQD